MNLKDGVVDDSDRELIDRNPRTRKTSGVVARRIAVMIKSQGFDVGDVLPAEAELMRRFGVSRASLREALRILELLGVVRTKPGPRGGPVIARLSSRDFGSVASLHFFLSSTTFEELLEARLIMEPLLARLAAERQIPDRLARLRSIVEKEPAVEDEPAYLEAAHEFHGVIASSSGNRVLDLYARSLKEIFTDRIAGALYPVGSRVRVQQEHSAIADAIFLGEADKAEALMRQHMEEFIEFVTAGRRAMMSEVVDWE